MATVTYTFDFEKFHLFRVLAATTLKAVADKGIKIAKARAGAHNRGGTNTVLVMNAGQEQQLHAYILLKKLSGDGKSVPVYGYAVIGKAKSGSASIHLGGTIEVNIKKEGGQNPTYILSHCGAISPDSYIGSTTHFKWETDLGTTVVDV